jgi:hypothetical protein
MQVKDAFCHGFIEKNKRQKCFSSIVYSLGLKPEAIV